MGAVGCPQVFIPASLELGWKLSNELMSKIGDEGILQAPWAVLGYLSPHQVQLGWTWLGLHSREN